jgi:hypothetical protein
LAQALREVKNTRSKEKLDAFVSKLRVYTISDQDDSGRWLRLTFPQNSLSPSAFTFALCSKIQRKLPIYSALD